MSDIVRIWQERVDALEAEAFMLRTELEHAEQSRDNWRDAHTEMQATIAGLHAERDAMRPVVTAAEWFMDTGQSGSLTKAVDAFRAAQQNGRTSSDERSREPEQPSVVWRDRYGNPAGNPRSVQRRREIQEGES